MAKQTLFVYQGTDFSTTLTLTADDGSAINVANSTFAAGIRQNPYSNFQSANLKAMATDAPNGVVTISLSAAETASMAIGSYLYTVTSNVSNLNSVLLDGLLIVGPSMTQTQPLPANVNNQVLDDEFFALSGQNSFYLSYEPANTSNVQIIYNNVPLANSTNVYTITGNILIFAKSAAQGDQIQAIENVPIVVM